MELGRTGGDRYLPECREKGVRVAKKQSKLDL